MRGSFELLKSKNVTHSSLCRTRIKPYMVYAVSKHMDQLLECLNIKLKICHECNIIGKVGALTAQVQKCTTHWPRLCKMENKSDQGLASRVCGLEIKAQFFVSAMDQTLSGILLQILLVYLAYTERCHGR